MKERRDVESARNFTSSEGAIQLSFAFHKTVNNGMGTISVQRQASPNRRYDWGDRCPTLYVRNRSLSVRERHRVRENASPRFIIIAAHVITR